MIDSKTLDTISKNLGTISKNSKSAKDMNKQLKDIAGSSKKDEKHSEALEKAFKKESGDRRTDNKALRKDITDSAAKRKLSGGDINQSAGNLIKGMDSFGGGLKETAGLLGIGGVFGALLGMLGNQVESYQSLINVGQNFGGSIMSMSAEAAHAGLSLKQMSDVVQKHATLVANVGIRTVTDNQKAVRGLIKQFGSFGMTVEQVNEFNASHL